MSIPTVRRCTVYRGEGEACALAIELDAAQLERAQLPVPGYVPLWAVMSRELICAHPDLQISAVVGLMIRHRVGCIPVVDPLRRPIGVITKLDLVEQLDASMRAAGSGCPMPPDLVAQTAEDVMIPLAISLHENASLHRAAATMAKEDTHHVLAVDAAGRLVGVVSARDIVAWLAATGARHLA